MKSSAKACVIEQNLKKVIWGLGAVFFDRAYNVPKADGPNALDLIVADVEGWQNVILNLPHGEIASDGAGFAVISCAHEIESLRERAEDQDLGAGIYFIHLTKLSDHLDGDANDSTGNRQAFGVPIDDLDGHLPRFGGSRAFDAFTQPLVQAEKGVWIVRHHRFSPTTYTIMGGCTDDLFEVWIFAEMDEGVSARFSAGIFGDLRDGATLISNGSIWRQFRDFGAKPGAQTIRSTRTTRAKPPIARSGRVPVLPWKMRYLHSARWPAIKANIRRSASRLSWPQTLRPFGPRPLTEISASHRSTPPMTL